MAVILVMFSGVLPYADDVVLLAPSAGAMRNMLLLCDDFANEFSVKFNASKSKCIVVQPRSSHLRTDSLGFYIGGNKIEIVDQWLHLGHMVTSKCDDDADIMDRRNSMVGQINNVLCHITHICCLCCAIHYLFLTLYASECCLLYTPVQ